MHYTEVNSQRKINLKSLFYVKAQPVFNQLLQTIDISERKDACNIMKFLNLIQQFPIILLKVVIKHFNEAIKFYKTATKTQADNMVTVYS